MKQDDTKLYALLDAKHLAEKNAISAFPPPLDVIHFWACKSGYESYLTEFLDEYNKHFKLNRNQSKLPTLSWDKL